MIFFLHSKKLWLELKAHSHSYQYLILVSHKCNMLLWTILCLPKIPVLKPELQYNGVWRWAFVRYVGVK